MLIIIVSIITIDKNKHVNIQLSNPENNNYQLRKKKKKKKWRDTCLFTSTPIACFLRIRCLLLALKL